ncbi:MAG: iron-sulfur cluster assembly accessory protein [Halobacteriovoraceae bacterium]|nr:iron-sulfur cluster assembly accessory protein [Halobacteriovoraceae bacterium]
MMESIVLFTDSAKEQIRAIFAKEQEKNKAPTGLRLMVVGGGCSGLSYKIDFDAKSDKDNIQSIDQINVFIDPKSSIYLKDTTLDYKDGLQGKGFVFINPNATNTCGCGESFAV